LTTGGPAPATSRRLARLYRVAPAVRTHREQAGCFSDATAVVAYAQAIADGATWCRLAALKTLGGKALTADSQP